MTTRNTIASALALAAVLGLAALSPLAEAAFTLQGIDKPARVTVATTVGTLTLPSGTEYIRIRPITVTGYLEFGCTDGAALGSHYETITADTVEVRAVHNNIRQGETICLAGSGSGTVEVTPLQRGR